MKREPVFEISEYHDGPRAGVASLRGQRVRFKSRYLDATEYNGDYEAADLFDLLPMDAPTGSKPTVATAEFHVVKKASSHQEWPTFEVTWQIVE